MTDVFSRCFHGSFMVLTFFAISFVRSVYFCIWILARTYLTVIKLQKMEPILTEELIRARKSEFSTQYKTTHGGSIGGYTADSALGSGRFATVWSVLGGSARAIKVYRSGRSNCEYWRNEVKILNLIAERKAMLNITAPNLIQYYGTFAIVSIDDRLEPNIHPCIVFARAGDSVSRLLKHCRREYSAGVPVECSRKIIRDTLRGLEFVHAAGLIHTDIKPSNLLLDRSLSDINGLDFNILIGDFGSSTPADDLFSRHVGTDLYLAPELVIDREYTTAIDIWATFVTAFELITGDPLFDVFHERAITYGSDVDSEGLEGLKVEDSSEDSAPELVSAMDCSEAVEGALCDQSGQLQHDLQHNLQQQDKSHSSMSCTDSNSSGQNALVAYRHLLLMEKVLGPPPREFTKSARNYYNARGKLKNNPAIRHISIYELLSQNYDMSHVESKALENFLLCGLKYDPAARVTAVTALEHSFLSAGI